MKIVIDIPEKTNAHIRSDYGHGYMALREEDKGILCYSIYHGTPYEDERPHGGWIPCSERLPDKSGKYLVEWCGDWGVDICIAEYSQSGKYWYAVGDGYEYRNIIAWMPLPEPYKEGGDPE